MKKILCVALAVLLGFSVPVIVRAKTFGTILSTENVPSITSDTAVIPNALLQNASITINNGSGISGGGAVALGGSLTLSATGVTSVSCTTITCSGTAPASFSIGANAIGNSQLANSSLTVTAGTGLSGGGAVSLGGSTTLTWNAASTLTGLINSTAAGTSYITGGALVIGATTTTGYFEVINGSNELLYNGNLNIYNDGGLYLRNALSTPYFQATNSSTGLVFVPLASSTGVRYLCINSSGVVDSQAAACVGT